MSSTTAVPVKFRRTLRIQPQTGVLVGLAVVAAALLTLQPGCAHVHELTAGGLARYDAMWLDMTVAMMLPTALPVMHALRRVAAGQGAASRAVAALGTGYCTVWAATGVVACALSVGIHDAVTKLATIVNRARALSAAPGASLVGGSDAPAATAHHAMPGMAATGASTHTAGLLMAAATLLLAGAFQFSPVARACVRACRSPFGFVARGWHGRAAVTDGFRIGIAFGVSCFGCCVALMTALVVAGMQSLVVMAGFGALMAAQKNSRYAQTIRQLTGIGLVTAGLVAGIIAGAT